MAEKTPTADINLALRRGDTTMRRVETTETFQSGEVPDRANPLNEREKGAVNEISKEASGDRGVSVSCGE